MSMSMEYSGKGNHTILVELFVYYQRNTDIVFSIIPPNNLDVMARKNHVWGMKYN